MLFTLLFALTNALWCNKYESKTIATNQVYMLSYSWIGGKCRVEDCSIPENRVHFENGMVLENLAVIDGDSKRSCCDFEGRRTDIETYVPQLLQYNYFYQNRISRILSITNMLYVMYGTCMPEDYRSPYGYFNATTLLYQNYNVWTYLRNYIYNFGEEYVYNAEKLNDMLSVRNFPSKVQWVCGENTNMLTGVNVCFTLNNKQLVQTECPSLANQNECGNYLYFPTTPKEGKETKCPF